MRAILLLAGEERTVIGSRLVVEVGGLAEIETFERTDPSAEADLWPAAAMRPFNKREVNRI